MLTSGLAFWRDGHPWIVLTDPIPKTGKVLCVNLTSLDDECVDDECILETADYAWIKHPTVVAFSYARLWDVEKLNYALEKGLIPFATPARLTSETFSKIRLAAQTARELSGALKKFL